ncbi:kin of IRRE-like protein 1 [Asterias rubens]|uniref:kin of IRRE-like protein 1 n=1 Tax=Asterias rubens TaxID=7604 RepID=UPI001455406A|nr:kin of IRRE-like protein 1 [Asterias rubens]
MSSLTLFLAVVVLVSTEHVSSLSLRTGPRNTKARMGDSVTLKCDIDGLDSEYIVWYHEPSKTYLTFNRDVREEVDDDRKQRYSITGSTFWNEFNLSIKNLQLLDNGYFYCGYVDGGTYKVLGSALLTVISPPDQSSPSCSSSITDGSGSSTPVVGDTVDLLCSWNGGQPIPTASWYRDGVGMSQTTEESFVWTRRVLTSEDNGMAFSCHMESEALDAPRSCTVMPLRIPPVVTVTPSLVTVNIGDTVIFTCRGASLRRITSYRWNIPSENLPRLRNRYQVINNQRSLRLINIEAEDDNLVVTCTVGTGRGLVGTGEATLRVHLPTTTPVPTTTEEPTTTPTSSLPTTTPSILGTQSPASRTRVLIDSEYITQYKTARLTTRQPAMPTEASAVAALPQTAVIGIGIAAAFVVLVVILALIVCVMRYRTKSSSIQRDTSMHLVNRTYDTVLAGGRIVDNPVLRNQPEFRSSFRVNPRPVAAVNPVLQADMPKNQNKPSVTYAKVNKRKYQSHAGARAQRPVTPLYDVVPDDETPEADQVEVNLGSDNPALGLTREPTYMNQNVVRADPDPRLFNAEGLTYAELELQNEGRLPSIKKDGTLYAKLK